MIPGPHQHRGASAAAVIALAVAWPGVAIAEDIRERPIDVRQEVLGDRKVTWVDWGVGGAAKVRSPELIREEQESLTLWLRSPELQVRLVRLADLASEAEVELVRRSMNKWMLEYNTIEQPTSFPRRLGVQRDEVALPLWAHGIPPAIRQAVQVIFFDDRDSTQRAFVEERRRATTLYTQAYCTGWRSGRDRDEYWKTKPGGPVAPIAVSADSFVSFYQVTAFPAVVTFKDDTMLIEQGMD